MTEGLSVVVVEGFRAGFFFLEGWVYKWGDKVVGCTCRIEKRGLVLLPGPFHPACTSLPHTK